MAYEPGAQDAHERRQGGPERRAGGGVPDGLLVGGVALLASVAALTWTSTGLAGVVAHGSWPENVSFVRTGTAVRSFLTAPSDIPGAWPGTPPEQLPSATVLWLVFLTQIVILFSTVLLVAIQVARWRARRQARREKQAEPGGLRPPEPPKDGGRVGLEPEFPPGPPPGGAGYETTNPGAGRSSPRGPAAYGPGGAGGFAPRDGRYAADSGAASMNAAQRPSAPDQGGWRGAPDADGTDGTDGTGGHAPGAPAAGGQGASTAGGAGPTRAAGTGPGTGGFAPEGPSPSAPGAATAGAAGNVVAAVLDAAEGLVVVDPDGRVWSKTARQRGKVGPVHVYDPGHVTDAPVRLRWAPQRGCGDMGVARRRAVALLAPVRPTEPIFQLDAETAETLLRCYLHAAALADDSLQHVLRWAHRDAKSPGQAGKILRTNGRAAPGASMELESALTAHPGRRDAAIELIGKALGGLEQLHIRQSCSPGRVDTLALDNVAGEGGTLYVVGDQKETSALRSALIDAVVADQPTLTVIG